MVFFKKKGNQLVATDIFTVLSKNINYIGIHFYTDKIISYLSISTIVGGKAFDLSAGISKNIKNLLPSFPYTFIFPIPKGQSKINVTFTIINDTSKPFDYAEVKEKGGINFDSGTYQIANVSPKKNNLKLSFFHIIRRVNNVRYINVVVTPKKKLQI